MILIKTFNGFELNSSDFISTATSAKTPPDAKPVFIEQSKADAMYAGTYTMDVRSVAVTVRIVDQANMDELESVLKEALKPGTSGLLVGTFTDESRDYQLNCVVQSIRLSSKFEGLYLAVFQTGESAWQTVAEESDTWVVSAAGDTKTITVGGYSPTRLSLAITPTELPATGWAYQRLYELVNKPGYDYKIRPWCLTLDTAALVTAGKMQADGDDILVVVDGVITNRWLADINTDHTHIWINLNLAAGRSMTLLTPVASSGAITSLTFAKNANNLAALTALPARGYLQHGTEWFEYTSKDLKKYRVNGVTRAALSTTMQAHAAADVFNWIEHVVFVLYGNSAATAPALTDASYDDTKPVFDLSASDNTTWVYTASTKFYDGASPNRTGKWTPTVTRVGPDSDIYLEKGLTEGSDPAMGMGIETFYKSGKVQSEKSTITWSFSHVGGITHVSMTGRKYRSKALWPATKAALLQRSNDAKKWVEVWYEETPTAVTTWEAITHASSAITSNMKTVRFILSGTLAAQADTDCYFEVLTASVVFVSANQPTGTFLTEKSNYLLNVSIQNLTTGDAVRLVFPVLLNTTMTLDAENYAVTYNGVNAASAMALDDDSRAVWVRLAVGANVLEITGDDIATLSIVPSWLERRL